MLRAEPGKEAINVIGKAPLHCCEVALLVLPEQAHHHIGQRSHHLRSAAPPHLAGVFVQRDVPPVMQPVLNATLLPA